MLASSHIDSVSPPSRTPSDDGPVAAATAAEWTLYVLVRGVAGVLTHVPTRAALWLSRRSADLGHLLMRERRALAAANLRATFALEDGDARLDTLVREAFRHLALVAVEFLILHRRFRARGAEGVLARCARMTNLDLLQAAAARGRGVVFVTGHIGNWEALGAIAGSLGVAVHAVHRPLDNPLVDRWASRLRTDFGTHLIKKRGAVKGLARALANGENVVVLMDQHAGRGALRVPFLGRKAFTHDTAARLAHRFGAPMLAAFALRTSRPLEFELLIEPVAEPDAAADKQREVARLTRAANDVLSRVIRAHPEQWLWLHRRWRDSAAGDGRAARG